MARTLYRTARWLVVIVAGLCALMLVPRYWHQRLDEAARTGAKPGGFMLFASARAPASDRAGCSDGAFAAAAAQNAQTMPSLVWSPFRRAEIGWATYEPLVMHAAGTGCGGDSEGFARALATWQGSHGLQATGVFDEAVFKVMLRDWNLGRPFARLMMKGSCPDAPAEWTLAQAAPAEGFSGKVIRLRPEALEAYRAMARAARAESPQAFRDPATMTIFSGFRSPDETTADCLLNGGCGGPEKANCSSHRTGLAMDVYLGHAPGYGPASTADANRLEISREPAYRWMVQNAGRFGLANYPFEPWHWEWTGQAGP